VGSQLPDNAKVMRWTVSRFRVCSGKPATFQCLWNHASIARNGTIAPVAEVPDLVDASMRQVPKNWSVEMRQSPDSDILLCKTLVIDCLAKEAGLPHFSASAHHIPTFHADTALRSRWRAHQDTASRY